MKLITPDKHSMNLQLFLAIFGMLLALAGWLMFVA